MRIEAVTVCIDYSDFLHETLPYNMHHFDNIIVVTSYEDKETQELCNHLGVECRPTDLHKYNSDKFAKARAIDYGLAFTRGDDWIVHLDADVWLPPGTRNWIKWSNPQEDCIYGIDRFNCIGYDNWRKFINRHPKDRHRLQHSHHCLLHPPPFDMGARICIREYGGYIPIGFFQMWHGSTNRRYPLHHGTAERSDVLHSLQWPLDKRRKMPEIFCVHLESEPCEMGSNWRGRTTKQFGCWNPFKHRHKNHHHKRHCYNI